MKYNEQKKKANNFVKIERNAGRIRKKTRAKEEMGQRAGSKWSVVFSDVSMLAVPLLAFQIVASSWSVCTNSLHLDFSTPFNRLFSFAVDVACSCVFVKF